MLDSIRTRLTLWYVGVLALALIVFSAGVYLLLARNLHRRMDESLRTSAESITISLVRERAEGETVEMMTLAGLRNAMLGGAMLARGRLAEAGSVGGTVLM